MVYTCKLAKIHTLPHLTTSKVAKVLAPFEAQNIHQHTPPFTRGRLKGVDSMAPSRRSTAAAERDGDSGKSYAQYLCVRAKVRH